MRTALAVLVWLLVALSAGPADAADAADAIVSGCAGGLGGGGYGVIVRRDGAIARFHRRAAFEEIEEVPLRKDAGLAQELFAELERLDFEDISYQSAGEMVCSLTLREGDDGHEVSWFYGDPEAPAEVTELAQRVQRLLAEDGAPP